MRILSTLNDFLSGDKHKIWRACWVVANTRDKEALLFLAEHFEEIKAKTEDVPIGGALRSNMKLREFALAKLKFVQENPDLCLCAMYSKIDVFDPQREEENGHIKITATENIDKKWPDYYLCECLYCWTTYKVTERYQQITWWKWQYLDETASVDNRKVSLFRKILGRN